MSRRWAAQLRVRHWAHFLALPLAGIDPEVGLSRTALALSRGVLITFCVLAFGYLLNSLSDRHMDRDREKNALPDRGLRRHYVSVGAFAAGGLGIASFAPWPVLAATLTSVVCGWVYSVGPRLKATPFVGSALNVGNFAPMLWVGAPSAEMPPSIGLVAPAFAAMLLQNQLLHEAGDADEDTRGRVSTTYLRLGRGASSVLAACAGLTLAAVSWLDGALATRVIAVLCVPPFVVVFPWWLRRHGDDLTRMRRARVAHRWVSLFAGAALFAAALSTR